MADASSSSTGESSVKKDQRAPHRRSKSAMVSSFLSTSSSHQNSASSKPASTSSSSLQSTANPATTEPDPPLPSGAASMSNSGVLVGGPKSVEETVRTFRLYEALRNGDTGAISRAIRDTVSTDGGRRASTTSLKGSSTVDLNRSNILHLAVQCAELPVIEYILSTTTSDPNSSSGLRHLDINHRDTNTGNTPLHLAAQLGRIEVVNLLLRQPDINDSIRNFNNRTPLEVARTPQVFQALQLARSMYLEKQIETLHLLVAKQDYDELEKLLETPRVKGLLDLNSLEPPTNGGGSTLLHDAARRRDTKLIQLLLMHGADPFRRDKDGKLPQNVTKDEKTKAVLKKSPAAVAAARNIEEKAVLGSAVDIGSGSADSSAGPLGGKESKEMKGYLRKWTNYTGGWKLRWFVLEDGVLSYYKNQEDINSACRGAINMRVAKLHMDPQDKQRFEIHGKGSVKYHLKANHIVEAKRWYWTLNNAIQWAKDEAREDERRKVGEAERMERMKEQQKHQEETPSEGGSMIEISRPESISHSMSRTESLGAGKQPSIIGESSNYSEGRLSRHRHLDEEHDEDTAGEEELGDDDDDSTHGPAEPPSSDALSLMANSARLQLDLLSQVALALQFEHANNPSLTLNDQSVVEAMKSYESAVASLKDLIGGVIAVSKERDAYWRHRLEKEISLRKLWEDNLTQLAEEQEVLEGQVIGERERRKKTKRALKEMIRKGDIGLGRSEQIDGIEKGDVQKLDERLKELAIAEQLEPEVAAELSDSGESDASDEFYDAVDSGDVEVVTEMPVSMKSPPIPVEEAHEEKRLGEDLWSKKLVAIRTSYAGYEDPPRERLKMEIDDRPKISLWGILKSMIGKDMTKMTLPVSFNEPTSLLQRVAEDMEYTDLLDYAASRSDSCERMVYVAAFAASEYSSTINRIAKPFNPLLGETYEYVRPDKNYRFFVEQVSHHPPVGAAMAESEKWDYWGESAVKSKFYGKSFDINPLGTWFLRLRPVNGGEELYTWKKVTSSVIGIITGSPTVDNYGDMDIKNWTTGESCKLNFKARGWRGGSAYEVKGRVIDQDSVQTWSVGGRWNDKLYARLSPGYDASVSPPPTTTSSIRSGSYGNTSAILIWENHPRPPAPFNLTPFAITLNALPDKLKPVLCPTDTRLRPDQRAMEDGQYDFAATEKNRVEEKQRAKRREREERGEEYKPKWFSKSRCDITGEEYWDFSGEYWKMRERVANREGQWEGVDDIF